MGKRKRSKINQIGRTMEPFKCFTMIRGIPIPELREDNYQEWKESILLHLGLMNLGYAITNDEPVITESNTQADKALYEQWERSNRLSTMFIKTNMPNGFRSLVEQYTDVKALLKAVDEQFAISKKILTSILADKLMSLRLARVGGVRGHIMKLKDIAAQLKALEAGVSESFLVFYILFTLPQPYSRVKISFYIDKDMWSIDKLLTMCVQEEERLLREYGG